MNDPAWLAFARRQIGTREIPGPTHNNKLIALLNTAARWNGVIWKDDEMPWCGGFAAACLVAAGIDPPKIAARAASWATWGANLRTDRLAPGAILVFSRFGGNHVGFYAGEDARYYHVVGGNQGNAVSYSRIANSRLIASRWPRGVPVIGGPVRMTEVAGIPVTTNEA
ncbi:TIGR02594 family protein [Sphingomonas sp. KR1UV-12]|uniref:TIGR02594 family protein n=1 Tax=Sphingomonas aurea TaxID=3063994 RepID=A0ABT9EHK0_9SPHN|nr:TIGR02594 family protein [Sphingomonas sp. KR1UV-12]MDP1026404.1 TIGR02594 family protein [Sphingomonas sp. KR1UV-12]